MNSRSTLRLGTRPSLLAIAQSSLVARELERLHPGLTTELVTIDTRGDRDRQTPLSEVSDPGFFASELDDALLSRTVDFCVHSWKDLERARPAGIQLAAVPQRADPRDVILFRAEVIDKLTRGETLTVGSSSARRQINTGDFLVHALPRFGKLPTVEFHPLRGPVDERVARIGQAARATALDGVVLALAGLTRLWADSDGRAAIAPHLRQARWMVLPLEACPTASGQGALAIECRNEDTRCLELLKALHHKDTADLLARESALLARYADTDPALLGVSSISHPELGQVSFVRGRTGEEQPKTIVATESSSIAAAEKHQMPRKAWSGEDWNKHTQRQTLATKLPTSGALFAAHWHALDRQPLDASVRCWTSGTASWRKLAEQGIWVEGCADNLGFAASTALLQTPVMQLPDLQDWVVLTHTDALDGWQSSGVREVRASYSLTPTPRNIDTSQLKNYTHFYWSSARQYEYFKAWLPTDAHHACGAGKTPTALRVAGLDNVQTFASRREWQQWLD